MKKQKEIWKDVKGFEGFYKVSNFGRVYGLVRKQYLNPYVDRYGYQYVQCCNKTGSYKTYKVHRMVYEAFVRDLTPNEDVNHVDKNRSNNNLRNLIAMNHAQHIKMHKLGHVTSQETKKKLSRAKKKYWDEYRKQIQEDYRSIKGF